MTDNQLLILLCRFPDLDGSVEEIREALAMNEPLRDDLIAAALAQLERAAERNQFADRLDDIAHAVQVLRGRLH